MAIRKTNSLFYVFFFVLIIPILQASRHEWDEATWSALKASKSSFVVPNDPSRTAYHFQPVKHWMNGIFLVSFFFLFHNDSFVRILIMDLRFTDINEFNCAWSTVRQITLKIQMVSIENEFESLYL